MSSNQQKLLNVGCGRRFHPAWRNVDLKSYDPNVLEHDLRQGIPFDENSFDVVYHSHVLEHMRPHDAKDFLGECWRVLKPTGVLRLAVPDLEGIAKSYLGAIERCDQSLPQSEADHEWMLLELIDQMVRQESGGQMGRYMSDPELKNPEFLQQRMGAEILNCVSHDASSFESASDDPNGNQNSPKQRGTFARKLREKLNRRMEKLRRSLLKRLYGKDIFDLIEQAQFRNEGEIHQWMYDRLSLERLLMQVGYVDVRVCSAFESEIPKFSEYELDVEKGQVCKPDSLFMEAHKPGQAAARAA